MRRFLIALLILICLGLGAGVFWVRSTSDRTGPEIRFAEDKNSVYELGTPKSELLEGVSAIDAKDGDVSDTLTIESVFARNEEQVVVIYVAKDNSNNVTKAEFDMKTTAPAIGVVQDVVSDEEEEAEAPEATENPEEGEENEASEEDEENKAPEEGGESASAEESGEPAPAAGPREQAEERELAKIEMLPEGAPRFYLTTYYLEIPRGTSLDRLSFVRDIQDDSENQSDLFRRIQIDGDVDIYTPGNYELIYYVVDNDGNTSNQAVLSVVVQ